MQVNTHTVCSCCGFLDLYHCHIQRLLKNFQAFPAVFELENHVSGLDEKSLYYCIIIWYETRYPLRFWISWYHGVLSYIVFILMMIVFQNKSMCWYLAVISTIICVGQGDFSPSHRTSEVLKDHVGYRSARILKPLIRWSDVKMQCSAGKTWVLKFG